MIVAAQRAGQYGESAPPALAQALQCRAWDVLPNAGGLLDQAYGLVEQFNALLNVYDSFAGYAHVEAGELVPWTIRNPSAWRIICWVWDDIVGHMT